VNNAKVGQAGEFGTQSRVLSAIDLRSRHPPLTFNGWLRYGIIRRTLRTVPRGSSILEIGCGGGALAARLADDFEYVGYEPDPDSFRLAQDRLRGRGEVINRHLPHPPERPFDVVAAFEVLEHLEDDLDSLQRWKEWIRPGGLLLLSVPANPARFGPWDSAAGHYRRYARSGLKEILLRAGYREPRVESVGMPLGYMLEFARNRLASPGAEADASLERRTARSGRLIQPPDRLGWVTRFGTAPFRLLQHPFRNTAFGTGLVAVARR